MGLGGYWPKWKVEADCGVGEKSKVKKKVGEKVVRHKNVLKKDVSVAREASNDRLDSRHISRKRKKGKKVKEKI